MMLTKESARVAVRQARVAYSERLGQARLVASQLKEARAELALLTTRVEDLGKISGFLATYSDERQAVVYRQIEGVVTQGLRTVFGEDFKLIIRPKMVGRRPELDFVLVSADGGLETSIMDARGGGVAAVAGFLIQVVLVLLTPNLRPVVFLDESFAHVSSNFEDPLADFIQELVERTPLQVVLVTHSPTYASYADRTYRFTQSNGLTKVEVDEH